MSASDAMTGSASLQGQQIEMKRSGRPIVRQIPVYLMTAIGAIAFGLPFFWTVASSLKTQMEIYSFPPVWLPAIPQWANYALVFELAPFGRFILNTIFVTVLAMTGQILSASAVAYGFARFRFPGRDALFMLVLATMMLPWQVTIVPQFLLFRYFGWIDTYFPLVLPAFFGGGAFYIFLLRQFFLTIPRDFDEAARLDGASSWTIFWRIVLPLSNAAIATVAIFTFIANWNNFMGPLIYLNSPRLYTVAIGLQYFQATPFAGDQPREAVLMAAAIITAAPCLAVFFLAQKYFVKGVVMSGIKG